MKSQTVVYDRDKDSISELYKVADGFNAKSGTYNKHRITYIKTTGEVVTIDGYCCTGSSTLIGLKENRDDYSEYVPVNYVLKIEKIVKKPVVETPTNTVYVVSPYAVSKVVGVYGEYYPL